MSKYHPIAPFPRVMSREQLEQASRDMDRPICSFYAHLIGSLDHKERCIEGRPFVLKFSRTVMHRD